MSQRSILQRTQSYLSGTISQRMPLTYFERVLEKCGIILPQANGIDSAYQLNCDHLQFVMALRTELYSNSQFPENTQQFLSGLQDLMRSQTHLVRLLSGCAVMLELFSLESCSHVCNILSGVFLVCSMRRFDCSMAKRRDHHKRV